MQKGKRDDMESKLGRDRAPAVALLFYVSSYVLGELGVGTGSPVGPPNVGRVGCSRARHRLARLRDVPRQLALPPIFAVLGPARAAPHPNMWSAVGASLSER
jgi:hypothetical protein